MASEPPASIPKLPFPLQPGERVLELCRRHWWHLWPKTIIWALFAVVPVRRPVVALRAGRPRRHRHLLLAGRHVWLLYWGVRLLLNWYRYHNDIWVITDQRIIDSFKPHPFQIRVGTADLVNVQDMTVEKNGVIPPS